MQRQQTSPQPASEPTPRGGRIMHVRAQDGVRLAARIFEPAAAVDPPLLCLAGLSRNSRDFMALGDFFARHPQQPRRVVALDARGRGLSGADPDWRRYTPLVEAQDVLSATTALGIERAIVIGTSRGGILAMLLGALRPALLAGVVLNDIGPVIEGTGLARIKQYLTARRSIRGWDDAEAATREAAGAHFPALTEEDWRAHTEALYVEAPEGPRPQFDPHLLKTLQDLDLTRKVPQLWPQFLSLAAVPVLVIRGAHSDILSSRSLGEMAQRHPRLDTFTVPGQGHPPLLRDAATLERIRTFAAGCRD